MVIVDNKYLGMVRAVQQLFYERNYAENRLSDNPDFVEIASLQDPRLASNEAAMAEVSSVGGTGDLIERFLRSPSPSLLVFDCHPEANVYPMVPARGSAFGRWCSETNREN